MTLEDLRTVDNRVFDAIQRANDSPTAVRLCVACSALDLYHNMIETIGRHYSPELWDARNPLDRRVP
jgi:hypothetical protein